MAKKNSTNELFEEVYNLSLELNVFANTSFDLAGSDPLCPQWPFLVICHSERLSKAIDELGKGLK